MNNQNKITGIQQELITLFAECDMNMSEASRRGYIHRNTISYHFDEVKKNTGIDPRKFFGLVELLNDINNSKLDK
jgi:sugar diacid utilization regulator